MEQLLAAKKRLLEMQHHLGDEVTKINWTSEWLSVNASQQNPLLRPSFDMKDHFPSSRAGSNRPE